MQRNRARTSTVVLGETTVVNFHLRIGVATEPVQVNLEASVAEPVVDVERSSQANTLNQQYINGLPIDSADCQLLLFWLPTCISFLRMGKITLSSKQND